MNKYNNNICHICNSTNFILLRSNSDIQSEISFRNNFILSRIIEPHNVSDLKDITEFVRDSSSEIIKCVNCNLLIRTDSTNVDSITLYKNDKYEHNTMLKLLENYKKAFRLKSKNYQGILRRSAQVLEIGSHVGGFIYVSTHEWGWNTIGLDVGEDISNFANGLGLITINTPFNENIFSHETFDAVFIWNCFEQIYDINIYLDNIYKILKPNGLLIIRTPNGFFYDMITKLVSLECLGGANLYLSLLYNNLLGFPYLFGYNSYNITKLLDANRFNLLTSYNSELIDVSSEVWYDNESNLKSKILNQLNNLSSEVKNYSNDLLFGPWIEFIFAKNTT